LKNSCAPTQESFDGNKEHARAFGYRIQGAHHPARGADGQIAIPLALARDLEQLRETPRHEAPGHFGTTTFTGAEKRAWRMTMDNQTWAIIVFGSVVAAFGLFASYMADRQKEQEKRESETS
jgi:hypothetical protein